MKLKENQKMLIAIFLLFLVVQGFGLYLGSKLVQEIPEAPMQAPEDGGFLFAYILFMTAVMLVLIKFIPQILKVMEFLAIFFSVEVFFELLFLGYIAQPTAFYIAIALALGLAILRIFKRTILTQNIAMLLSILGIGALLGASLGFIPALILLGALTLYDVIAVFYTKHMVTMAKEITKQKLAFTMAIPTKRHLFHLGGGDLIMPMLFTVAVFREFGLAVALSTMAGSMIVLVAFFSWLFKNPGRAYPALPPVTTGAFLGLGAAIATKMLLGI